MLKTIPCLIRTLAPVHLGADEVYEPLSFVIDEQKSCLVAFEPWSLLEKLPDRDRAEFDRLCRKGTVDSLLEIYLFLRERRGLAQGRAVAVCPGLLHHYQQVLSLSPAEFRRQLTQFTIHRTAFLARDQRPYIPGSAVKGALRTAYLNALARIRKTDTPTKTTKSGKLVFDPATLEKRLLDYDQIPQDPFRLLKVSDFLPVGEVQTRIVYAVNEKKKISKFQARGPYQILEVIEPGAAFLGTIEVADLPPELRRLAKINHFFTLEELFQAAQNFYRQEKKQEDSHLFDLGLTAAPLPAGNGRTPLRLGRHSGAECVTIAGHRHIKIMQARGERPQELPHATTLWLAADFHQRDHRQKANLRPMGWAALEELTPEARQELADREAAFRQQVEESRRALAVGGIGGEATAGEEVEGESGVTPAREVWEGAVLTWDPGSATLTAAWQNRKAYLRGKHHVREVLPASLHKQLLEKRWSVARATVDPLDFRIVAVEAL